MEKIEKRIRTPNYVLGGEKGEFILTIQEVKFAVKWLYVCREREQTALSNLTSSYANVEPVDRKTISIVQHVQM